MIPIVSATLTVARAIRGLSMKDVAAMAGVEINDVFQTENFLEKADLVSIQLIAIALDVDLTKLISSH